MFAFSFFRFRFIFMGAFVYIIVVLKFIVEIQPKQHTHTHTSKWFRFCSNFLLFCLSFKCQIVSLCFGFIGLTFIVSSKIASKFSRPSNHKNPFERAFDMHFVFFFMSHVCMRSCVFSQMIYINFLLLHVMRVHLSWCWHILAVWASEWQPVCGCLQVWLLGKFRKKSKSQIVNSFCIEFQRFNELHGPNGWASADVWDQNGLTHRVDLTQFE